MTTFLNPVGRKLQVPKEDMYMFTALWMQESPWAVESTPNLNVVGSVFVLPNDRVLSADCTRQHPDHNIPVHGAIRPLIKYPDKVKGCQVYLTRKPCANCVKMLVQARVSKVFYLPLQPEKPLKKDAYENKSVDALFQVSEVSKSFYVPNIFPELIDKKDPKKRPKLIYELTEAGGNNKKCLYGINNEILDKVEKEQQWKTFLKTKQGWDDSWIKDIKEHLDWQEFGDDGIKKQVNSDMNYAFQWFYLATHGTGESTLAKDGMAWKFEDKDWREPNENENERRKRHEQQTHLSRLAQMLSNRTDDPNTGVGCVIVDGEEIVSIGWNGFPSKALYGNHPRGSDNDPTELAKTASSHGSDQQKEENGRKRKYAHVIYAAQNALLSRNQRNIENSVVYINIIPGNECMSMLYELGVERLVVPSTPPNEDKLKKNCYFDLLKSKKIRVLMHNKAIDQMTTGEQSTEQSQNASENSQTGS